MQKFVYLEAIARLEAIASRWGLEVQNGLLLKETRRSLRLCKNRPMHYHPKCCPQSISRASSANENLMFVQVNLPRTTHLTIAQESPASRYFWVSWKNSANWASWAIGQPTLSSPAWRLGKGNFSLLVANLHSSPNVSWWIHHQLFARPYSCRSRSWNTSWST